MKWVLFWRKPKTVASITASLNKMVSNLRAHAAHQANQAEAARTRADHHDGESARALTVLGRIESLVA